jgi:transcriptional regulator with XRE-family HTH domain
MRINPHALRVIRERSGLSQAALGRAAKVSQGHISQLEAGQKEPRPDMVQRLAVALGVPVTALVTAPAEPAEAVESSPAAEAAE